FGIGKQRGDRAVDVELGVRTGIAAVGHVEREQLVARLLQRVRHALQQRAAFGEAQRAQRRSAGMARMLEGRGEVDTIAARGGERCFRGGIDQRLRRAASLDPAAAGVTRQNLHYFPPEQTSEGRLYAYPSQASAESTSAKFLTFRPRLPATRSIILFASTKPGVWCTNAIRCCGVAPSEGSRSTR